MLVDNYRTPLARYAIKDMYSNPGTGRQFQLMLTQVSPDVGYINTFQFMGRYRKTPIERDYFMIYNMSGFDGSTWNFHELFTRMDPVDQWINVAKICKERGMIIDIYGDDGRLYPRDKCWIMSTYDGQQLLAIQKLRAFKQSWKEPRYVHCYTIQTEVYNPLTNNQQLDWPRFSSNNDNSAEEKDRMKIIYAEYLKLPGLTSVYLNGYLWDGFPADANLLNAEVIEITNDPSVWKTESYEVGSLPNFQSKRDNVRKLIIHPPKVEGEFGYQYVADVAFYLVNRKRRGVYLNRNEASHFRQLTHRDYAVSASLVDDKSSMEELLNEDRPQLLLVYRRNNYAQEIPYESNGVRWLYRMNDENIVGALIGINSTMKEWLAVNLEQSPTNEFLTIPYKDITHELAVESIGYNRATQVLCASPMSYDASTGMELEVPPACRNELTMFEYDPDGLFLRMRHLSRVNFVKPNSDVGLVEFFPGKPGRRIHAEAGRGVMNVDPNTTPRFYVQAVTTEGEYAGERIPAIEGKDYTFDRDTGNVTWTLLSKMFIGVILYNDQTLYKEFTLDHIDNSLTFSITREWLQGGLLMDVAPANIMVIMNRHSLIENVDYVVDFPDVHILNHQYLKDGGNDFVLYCSEWSPIDDKTPLEQSELGYVTGGVIGHNLRYNLREDRVTRTTIDGKVWDPALVPVAELDAPSELLNTLNGKPYGVKHWYLPLRDWVAYDNTAGWEEARDRDRRMSQYLTLFAKKPEPTVIPSLMDKYRVFSPFMNMVVNRILLGLLELDDLPSGESYSKDYVLRKTADFQWLLKYDPVERDYDVRYFAVFPYVQQHTALVEAKELIFIQRVNEVFLKSRININGHFEVKNV
ncbi:hypothetical protein [Vibrio phage VP4B]|uniref:Virion structural protein n=1 Tax=Vibrio phage VP4B TaxID=1262540 RepID=V9LZZ6_9CAUD|nr:hypothetical protein FDJ61_gp047 [Vibrio phage VP4B]AGB07161.1 hypothetical protein [Vibrio phage VP4B]